MAIDLKALEQKSVAEIKAALAEIPKLQDFITKVKGSPAEALVEKLWPGVTTVEADLLSVLGFLSGLGTELLILLDLFFPQPAA